MSKVAQKSYFRFLFLFIAMVMIFLSLPTVLIDVYNSQDITNRSFTTYVHKDEMDACRWIEKNLPTQTVVQAEMNTRGNFFSLIPTFAGRRAAAGDTMHSHIFQLPRKDYIKRSEQIYEAFSTCNLFKMMKISEKLGIDQFFWGIPEHNLFLPGLEKFEYTISLLPRIFHNNSVSIYTVNEKLSEMIFVRRNVRDSNTFQLTLVNPNQKLPLYYAIHSTGISEVNEKYEEIKPLTTLQKKLDFAHENSDPLDDKELLVTAKVTRKYSMDMLKTQIGHRVESDHSANMKGDPGEEGFLLYGPYHYFAPGTYEITFMVKVVNKDMKDNKDSFGYLDIYAIERRKEFGRRELRDTPDFTSFTIPVTLTAPEKLEFRVYSTGNASITVSEVTISGTEKPIHLPLKSLLR